MLRKLFWMAIYLRFVQAPVNPNFITSAAEHAAKVADAGVEEFNKRLRQGEPRLLGD